MRRPRPARLTLATAALLAPLLVGCASNRTVPGDYLAELHREAMLGPMGAEWYYLGSDERYHYVAPGSIEVSGDVDRHRYRVPRDELPVARPFPYSPGGSRQLLLKRQAPTLYPWYRELRPEPADLTERWGPTIRPRDGVRHDPRAPLMRREPPSAPGAPGARDR